MKRKIAFTLAELLLVITIIGILAALGVVSYNGAHAKSRDAKRQADAQIMASALELYKADNKKYPTYASPSFQAGCITKNCDAAPPVSNDDITREANWKEIQAKMAIYLSPLPIDPKAGQVLPDFDTRKFAYYYYDYDRTNSDSSTCGRDATRGNCYTLFFGPTERVVDEVYCQIPNQTPELPTGRYICIKN